MKKCEFCAKEISYHEFYCSDECQNGANAFFELREKYQKFFGVINGIFVIAIGICIFLYAFSHDVGALGASVSMMILGIMYFFLPFPPEVMIHRYKLKKAIFLTRVIAGILFLLGVIAMLFYLIGLL